MTATRISPRRLDLLRNLGDVLHYRWSGDSYRRRGSQHRDLRVTADVRWLADAGLVEIDPRDHDLDVQSYRLTDAGSQALKDAA